ncbi:MAG: MAPEG family protein [Bdellovibrionales bacterium]|nr:MAPEG family protein [Bdellovibrionales bacterium]
MITTSLYAGILSLLYFVISIETIQARGREKVSLGTGSENQIIHLVSAHSNFASYSPIFLILLLLVEQNQINTFVLHLSALVFLAGRILHYLSMRTKETTIKKRKLGMQCTLFPIVTLATLNIGFFFQYLCVS